ncbi:MAG: 50S ribosomal protein L11 methyltransferase [Chloroflexi bacterium]|nr:50S ribosomal protein L11 methyltransferase [Chloroflexota bacterium]
MTTEPADAEWLELSTLAEPEAVESISEAFSQWGQGVAIEQPVVSSADGDQVSLPSDVPVLVKTYLPFAHPELGTRRAQIERAVWALGRLRQVGPLHERRLRESEWATAWKDYFFVHRAAPRTVIVPSWRQDEYAPRDRDVVLLLDPGMAFGTGLHPTTRLCLALLEELVPRQGRVLDLGAGSGILAIAAAKLGASRVRAIEVDPLAARVARENVVRNGADDVVAVEAGTLTDATERFDLAVANISLRVLLEVREPLAQALRGGGRAILSGVLAERMDELLVVLAADGWQYERTVQEQDWVALVVRAPAAA